MATFPPKPTTRWEWWIHVWRWIGMHHFLANADAELIARYNVCSKRIDD
jgi:hypothetical protein